MPKALRDLVRMAATMGVTVHASHIVDADGFYDHEAKQIHAHLGLTATRFRDTVAHELGHAYRGHDCHHPRHEREASRFAAVVLIDPAEYARAERIDSSPWAIAEELDVTLETVLEFRDYLNEQAIA